MDFMDTEAWMSSFFFFSLMIKLSAVKLYFIRKIRDYQTGSSSPSRKFPMGQTGKKPLSRDNLCFIFILHVVDNSHDHVLSDFSVPGAALFYLRSVISIRLWPCESGIIICFRNEEMEVWKLQLISWLSPTFVLWIKVPGAIRWSFLPPLHFLLIDLYL